MRSREGTRLCEDVEARAGLIAGMVDFIEKRSPDSVEEYRARIAQRMTDILDGSELSQQRILQEAALFADKVSVTRSWWRLGSICISSSRCSAAKTAVGARLDFLVQEDEDREAKHRRKQGNDYESPARRRSQGRVEIRERFNLNREVRYGSL